MLYNFFWIDYFQINCSVQFRKMSEKFDNPENDWIYVSFLIAFLIIGLVGGWLYAYNHFESVFGIIAITLLITIGVLLIGDWTSRLVIELFGKEPWETNYSSQQSNTGNSKTKSFNPFDIIYKDRYILLQSKPEDDLETIKRNYRRLLMEYHPDKLGNGASESIKQHAKEMTQKLVEAYETIEGLRKILNQK